MFWYVVVFIWGACAGSLVTSYYIRVGIRKALKKGG